MPCKPQVISFNENILGAVPVSPQPIFWSDACTWLDLRHQRGLNLNNGSKLLASTVILALLLPLQC